MTILALAEVIANDVGFDFHAASEEARGRWLEKAKWYLVVGVELNVSTKEQKK